MKAVPKRTAAAVAGVLALALLVSLAMLGSAEGPTVLQRTPTPGEELALDAPIIIVFDRPMDRASVEAAFSLAPTAPGRFSWSDLRTLRFLPAASWERNTEFSVTISTGAVSRTGERLPAPHAFSFRTVGYLDVVQTVPAPGTNDVAVDSTVVVSFSRPVVPLTALSDPKRGQLPEPLSFDPQIPGSGTWLNTSVYRFTPDEPLHGGATYTVSIRSGLSGPAGRIVPEDVGWQFTTERPRVVRTSPSSDEQLVPIDADIRIAFNMSVSLDAARSRFHLRSSRPFGEPAAAELTGELIVDGNTLVFTPAEPLGFDRSYVVSLDAGITDRHGGLGTEKRTEWRFQTVPLPRIVATRPTDGASDADPHTAFVLRFNTPIEPASVLANVTIEPAPDPDAISGFFRPWDKEYVLRFGAQPSTEYTVHVGPDIADPYGNTTEQPMTVRFRTRALDPAAWLHVPGWIGTFSSHEPARLFVAHRNVDAIEVTLSRISLDGYFEAAEDWYDYAPPSSGRLRRWSVGVSAPLNEVGYTPVDLTPTGEPLQPGIYVVELGARGLDWNRWQHRHLLVASPLNLTIKSADDDETLVWATDLETGAPLGGIILRAYDARGNPTGVSITDRDGLAVFPDAGKDDWRGTTFASNIPFSITSSRWDEGISVWAFDYPSGRRQTMRVFLDTDRPIYRPDQTVYYKGVVRAEDDVTYHLPTAAEADVVIRDGAWNVVREAAVPLDDYGAFSGELQLGDDAVLGDYVIEATIDGRRFSHRFTVAAYRPPEFGVSVTPQKEAAALGEPVDVTVALEYFFGGPVAGVPVAWSVFSEPYRFSPLQLERYTFTDSEDPWICRSCWWRDPQPPTSVLEGRATSNADGTVRIELPPSIGTLHLDETGSFAGSRRLTVEATATGNDGSVLSGRESLVVHAGTYYIGVATPGSIARAGDPVDVDVITVDWDGNRVGDRSLRYTVYRREWENAFEENAAGGGRWTWTTVDTEIDAGTMETAGDGEAHFSFVPPSAGTYRVVASGIDARERTLRSSLFVWASGPGTVSWRRSNDDRISLISDKSDYRVGETAEILIPSPYAGQPWALITVERAGILSRQVVQLDSNSSVFRLPVTEEHIPNVYVSVVLVQGAEAARAALDGAPPAASTKVGYVELGVSTDPKTLHIDLSPSDPLPEPGESIRYRIEVTDDQGRPVQASVAVDVVDKAVLTLSPRSTDAIVDAFYGRRGLGVDTASGLTISINRLVLEQLEQLAVADVTSYSAATMDAGAIAPMAAPPGEAAEEAIRGAGDAKAQLPAGVDVRERFEDTAYWNAHVTTGADGRAEVTIELPDNLTTWVARGVGATLETQVGVATDELLVTKPLLIRPVTPRFLVVGDRVRLAANVSNQTAEDRTIDVSLGQSGLEMESPATQSVLVSGGGEGTVIWWATVLDTASVDLAFSAVSGELADAARPRLATGPDGTLPVYRYTAPETVGTAGQLPEAGSRTEVVALPHNADADNSEVLIRLESSLGAAMQKGLSYLEHFEYECTEQVVSRFLPNVLTYRALQRLGIEDAALAERLPALVAEGLEKLSVRQNGDGGWGWWSLDRSSPTLTAYVIFALHHVREAGYAVDPDLLDRGIDFLAERLVAAEQLSTTGTANRQAWILYVLSAAGWDGPVSRHAAVLIDERALLSHYARAYLVLTLAQVGRENRSIDTLVSDLYSSAILTASGAHWEEETVDWWAMNTDTRSTAIILAALVKLDPSAPLLPNVVRWLMVARRDGIWETTQETAWALIALTDWMETTRELEGNYSYAATLDGRALYEGTASPQTHLETTEVIVPGADLDPVGGNRLTFSREAGPGTLYYTAHLSVRLPVEEVAPLDRGIVVQRQILPADCPLEESCEQLSKVEVGETFQVRLTIIAPHDLYYVVVEDPFPAGCEAVDTTLATTSLTEEEPRLYRETDDGWPWFYGWWRWYTRSELRDEKLALFADYLPAGTYTYRYTLRAIVPGTYHVLPSSAHEFYFPEVFGRSDGRKLVVEAPD